MDGIERELNSLKSQIIDLQRRIAPFSDPRGVNVRTQLQPRRRIFAKITDKRTYSYTTTEDQIWYSWQQIIETLPLWVDMTPISRSEFVLLAGGESGELNAIELNDYELNVGTNVEVIESPFDSSIWYINIGVPNSLDLCVVTVAGVVTEVHTIAPDGTETTVPECGDTTIEPCAAIAEFCERVPQAYELDLSGTTWEGGWSADSVDPSTCNCENLLPATDVGFGTGIYRLTYYEYGPPIADPAVCGWSTVLICSHQVSVSLTYDDSDGTMRLSFQTNIHSGVPHGGFSYSIPIGSWNCTGANVFNFDVSSFYDSESDFYSCADESNNFTGPLTVTLTPV